MQRKKGVEACCSCGSWWERTEEQHKQLYLPRSRTDASRKHSFRAGPTARCEQLAETSKGHWPSQRVGFYTLTLSKGGVAAWGH